MALSMAACGSPVNREILPEIPSKSMVSRVMLPTFATNHSLLKIMLYFLKVPDPCSRLYLGIWIFLQNRVLYLE